MQAIDGDTSFCFTIEQSKIIAKHLTNSVYCDTLLSETEKQKQLLEQTISSKDNIIGKLENKVENQESIIANNEKIEQNLKEIITQKDKQIRKLKVHRIILSGLVIFVAILAII